MLGLAVAALGWVADTQTKVVSDVRDLVPSNMKALKDAKTLQDTTDVSGEIDVMVGAKDLTNPKVLNWMIDFQQVGYLFLITQEREVEPFERSLALWARLGVPARRVDQQQIHALFPELAIEDVRFGTFCGTDGHADSSCKGQGPV